jgi:hypothetical protein
MNPFRNVFGYTWIVFLLNLTLIWKLIIFIDMKITRSKISSMLDGPVKVILQFLGRFNERMIVE